MKLKKMMAMLLVGATCVGMMAGCGSNGGNTSSGSAESTGSGDKGTPVVLVQGYFDNYTD